MWHIILASQSPRRRELLQLMGVTSEAVPSDFDEYLGHSHTPQEVT